MNKLQDAKSLMKDIAPTNTASLLIGRIGLRLLLIRTIEAQTTGVRTSIMASALGKQPALYHIKRTELNKNQQQNHID